MAEFKYFPEVPSKVSYDPKAKKGQLVYRFYNPAGTIGGKPMPELMPWGVAAWHAVRGKGADPFGPGARKLPWLDDPNSRQTMQECASALFELCVKTRAPFYCWHNWDLAHQGDSLKESLANLKKTTAFLKSLQGDTGVRLGWGMANLFSDPEYVAGAATSPSPMAYRRAGAEIAAMLEATKELNGNGHTFWGGREGLDFVLNTRMKFELDNFANLLRMSVAHAQNIGFTGQFWIKPKKREPKANQYDADAATVFAFLQHHRLLEFFRLNIEAGHANLAGNSFAYELDYAGTHGILGSVDLNENHPQCGWDTDHLPVTISPSLVNAVLCVQRHGGLHEKGLWNLDAKLRAESTDLYDIFWGIIGSVDALALAHKIAHLIKKDGVIDEIIVQRYEQWFTPGGREIAEATSLNELREQAFASTLSDPTANYVPSGREEMIGTIINSYLTDPRIHDENI